MTALYRRYRPESFQEVIGQSHVTEPIRHALAADKIHHAYLFSGPRGCGKTTSARILARCLNCAEGPTDTPCGNCASCVELSRDGGGSLDVVEIDAASHNGVDDARELRERAIFAPARDRYKIFILDEAHMVTHQGFNALLKIVEEPPEHVKFIFATTEPEKVLTTIRSRTHHYPFRLVPPTEILSYLEGVASAEGLVLEPGVLALVAQAGGGSVRDSLSLLDQLSAGSTDARVSLSFAQALLGYTESAVLDGLLTALATNDAIALFTTLNSALEAGNDARRLVEDLLSRVRDIIVVQAMRAGAEGLFPGLGPEDFRVRLEQATLFSALQLSEMAEAIADALMRMAGLTSSRLQLELLAARLMAITAPSHDQSSPSRPESHRTTEHISVAPTNFSPTSDGVTHKQSAEKEDSLSQGEETNPAQAIEPWNLEVALRLWPEIVEEIANQKRSLWVALSQTVPVAVEGDVLTIGFPRRGDAEILKKPQGPGSPLTNAELLREAIFQRTGHRVRFTVTETGAAQSLTQNSRSPESSQPDEAIGRAETSDHAQSGHENSGNSSSSSIHASESDSDFDSATIASRGEPVVRQLLGGELVGEEILESMSDRGELDA